MRYNNTINYRRRKRFIVRVRIFFAILILGLASVVGWVAYDNFRRDNANTEESTTSSQTTSYYASSVQVFRSPYFQFQADNTWAEVPTESTPNKFVYRSLRSNLIEHQLVIYVDKIPGDLSATRALPAMIREGNQLSANKVSDHCNKDGVKSQQATRSVPVDQTIIMCKMNDTAYSVLVGAVNGSSKITLKRPGGTTSDYTIYYNNLTAVPNSSTLLQIVNTFQTR